MKSKRIATYGKETACCSFGGYRVHGSFYHKSTVTAIAVAVTV